MLTDGFCLVNSVNLSDHAKTITLTVAPAMLDETHMGDTIMRRRPGLADWSVDIEFFEDFAAANVDATLFPLIGAAAFPVEIRPTSAGRSTTNPGYNGNMVLASITPIAGQVGQMAMNKASFKSAGALTRSTS